MTKIKWYLALPLCILMVCGLWYWRTKDMDFVKPPPIKVSPNRAISTSDPELAPDRNNNGQNSPLPAPNTEPTQTPIEQFAIQESQLSPSLDAFIEFAKIDSPTDLLELSEAFEKVGAPQQALLTLERILDTADTTGFDLSSIDESLAKLHESVPPWNLDPEDSISIQLNVSTSASRHRAIQEAAETAAATIQQASGQTLSIKLKLTSPKAVLPSTPIAVSFSSEDGQLTTPVFSSRPSAEESEELAQTLYQSIFGTVRSHLTKENPRQVKEASPETSDHFNILKNRVSRLSWLRMGESLHLKE